MPCDEREGGYIRAYRSIESSEDFAGLRADQSWVALRIVQLANWKSAVFTVERGTYRHAIQVDRAELAYSEETIAKRTKVTRKIVRTTIHRLLESGFLFAKLVQPSGQPSGQPIRVLRVVNYDKFNPPMEQAGQPLGQQSGQERDRSGTGAGPDRIKGNKGEEREETTLARDPADAVSAPPVPPAGSDPPGTSAAPPTLATGDGGTTSPPPPTPKKTTPQGEAFDFWKASIWPKLSTVPCPKPTKAEMAQLARRCKEIGLTEITAAMQRAEQDPYWHEKLDLLTFCSKIPKFLPRIDGPLNGKGASPPSEFTRSGNLDVTTGEWFPFEDQI
jgi:hypothetical protein